ncbi:MAG TPA: chorismate-binding protein, partial [Pyrodictium sp.]|nr:chorismate-binding protein [Pyrodictium sp.]
RKGVKIGLFKSPETGKYFRAKVPDDYPICG